MYTSCYQRSHHQIKRSLLHLFLPPNNWKHQFSLHLSSSRFDLVHCCYYISLLPGWLNIVQSGNPLYADVNNKCDCGGHIWPNWVQFFAKTHGSYVWCINKIISASKNRFWGTGEAFFWTLVTLSKLRIIAKIEDYVCKKHIILANHLSLTHSGNLVFQNWGFILIFGNLFPEPKCLI